MILMNKELKTYATHFCGVGGACYGLESAGLECRFAIDYLDFAVATRHKNLGHMAVNMDIREYVPTPADAADVLWTSPPCQTFSTWTKVDGDVDPLDDRNTLFMSSAKYVRTFRPRFVILENVMGLIKHDVDGAGGGTLNAMKKTFTDMGYHVEWNVFNSAEFGLPQRRDRVFLVASRDGQKGLLPLSPSIQAKFGSIMEHNVIAAAWSKKNYRTAVNKVERLNDGPSPYKITVVGEDDILPTLTCGFSGGPTRKRTSVVDCTESGLHFMRSVTVREGARAQGFPDTWELPKNSSQAWTLIGNAVSSPVAKAIAEHLKLVAVGEKPPCQTELSIARIARYVEEYVENASFQASLGLNSMKKISQPAPEEYAPQMISL